MWALLPAYCRSTPAHDAAALSALTGNSCSAQQPSVTVAGDHAMSLSDGQSFESLNTGVVIYPCVAGSK